MRIALVAMSGVRACDEELLRLGLTLPGFVERSKIIASLPSLGLLTLAGMTPPVHHCEYIEVEDIRKLGELPGGFDLVAISSYSAQMHEAYELADRYRQRGVAVVLGGLHGHTPDVFDQVYRFAEESELFDVQITIQTPFPGTPLYRRLKRQNRLLADGAWERCTLFDVNFEPRPMTADELAEGFRRLAVRLYSEEITKVAAREFQPEVPSSRTPRPGVRIMKPPKWIAPLFWVAAVYDGVLGLLFVVAPKLPFELFEVTLPNHPGYVQFPAALLLVFALMFVAVALSPVRNRNLIPYGILLKVAYCSVTFAYWARGDIPAMWKPLAITDLVMGLLFAWAYAAINPQPESAPT